MLEDDREASFKIDGETIDFLSEYKDYLGVESEADVMMIALSVLQWYRSVEGQLSILDEDGELHTVELEFK